MRAPPKVLFDDNIWVDLIFSQCVWTCCYSHVSHYFFFFPAYMRPLGPFSAFQPKVPGPGHYITSSDQAHVQACGPQVLSTQTSLRQVGLSAPSSLSEQEAARLAAYAVTCAPKKGGTFDWPDRGPVATTSRGAKVTNASIGVRQPSSTLRNASAFTFTERVRSLTRMKS